MLVDNLPKHDRICCEVGHWKIILVVPWRGRLEKNVGIPQFPVSHGKSTENDRNANFGKWENAPNDPIFSCEDV